MRITENTLQSQRENYIDVMKGIGILLVCLGHTIGVTNEPVNMWILSFHMPLFFFVSGMLFYNKDVYKQSFLQFVGHKSFTILIPQITCAFIGFITHTGWYVIITKEKQLLEIINFDLLGWFLLALFLMEIVMWWTLHAKKKWIPIGVCLLSAVAFFVIPVASKMVDSIIKNALLDYIWKIAEQTAIAVVFGFLGMYARPLVDWYRKKTQYFGVGLFLICISAFLSAQNAPVLMYINDYGNKILFFITAIIGIVAVTDLSILLDKSKILAWFGRNSIVIYVVQFAMTMFLANFAKKLFGWPVGAYPHYFLVFLCVVVLLVPVVYLANAFFPFLFGKRKRNGIVKQIR